MIGTRLILLNEVDSTNNYAAKLLQEGILSHGTVILAEKQTAGRGQRGNTWSAMSDGQFTASYYIDTRMLGQQDYVAFNMMVALAVRAAVASLAGSEVAIKWPNDILVLDRKISGILIEAQWNSGKMVGAIVGIGVNLNGETGLPSSISLSEMSATIVSRLDMLAVLSEHLNRLFLKLLDEGSFSISNEYHRFLWRKGMLQTVEKSDGSTLTGTIREVDKEGNLVFDSDKGVYTFRIQDVKFRY